MPTTRNLKEVAAVFFKLGCFAFGGPAAHIAMMEDEVVTKRQWMTRQHFLDLMGATNLKELFSVSIAIFFSPRR